MPSSRIPDQALHLSIDPGSTSSPKVRCGGWRWAQTPGITPHHRRVLGHLLLQTVPWSPSCSRPQAQATVTHKCPSQGLESTECVEKVKSGKSGGEESEGLRHKNWEQVTGETWEPTMPSGTSHTLTHTHTLPTGQRGSKPRNCHPGRCAPLLPAL